MFNDTFRLMIILNLICFSFSTIDYVLAKLYVYNVIDNIFRPSFAIKTQLCLRLYYAVTVGL